MTCSLEEEEPGLVGPEMASVVIVSVLSDCDCDEKGREGVEFVSRVKTMGRLNGSNTTTKTGTMKKIPEERL